MPSTRQYTVSCREDWFPILEAMNTVINEVMASGEKQRVDAGLDPNGWLKADPIKRLNHVMHHVLKCHHEGNLKALTENTYLEEWKHALTGLGIIAYHQLKADEPEVIEE